MDRIEDSLAVFARARSEFPDLESLAIFEALTLPAVEEHRQVLLDGLARHIAERAGICLVELKNDRLRRPLILGEHDEDRFDPPSDSPNWYVVVPALSHALAGPSRHAAATAFPANYCHHWPHRCTQQGGRRRRQNGETGNGPSMHVFGI